MTKCWNTSPYNNIRTPEIFRSFLAHVRSINACPVMMSEWNRAADELKMNALIASDGIVSATHLRIRYDTADECVLYSRWTLLVLELNMFRTGVWRRMCYMLESGDEYFSTGDERVEKRIRTSAMDTQLATSYMYFKTEHPSRCLLLTHRYLPLKPGSIVLLYSPRVPYCNSVLCWTKHSSSTPG